jgi:hypothetical protein
MPRPESYSDEAIYDAYARDDEDDLRPATVVVSPTPMDEKPILQQPQPQRVLMLPPEMQDPSPGPSPSAPLLPGHHPFIARSPPISISETSPRKEKDKKGLFGKWGGDKSGKKGSKAKDREDRVAAAEREKESGFFGSLFGKKKQDSDPSSITGGSISGREAAQALLGASKSSKAFTPSPSPGLVPGVDGNPYARYPIHVERAIYRLSHIKLANPRRPLYEQVLISNLMFWYLGVINKAQNPAPPAQPAQTTEGASNENLDDKDLAEKEREKRENEEREKIEKERLESERLEKEQRERELELKKKESGRRGTLSKMPPGARHAEMPVKGPQYEKQHRVMEQEYGPYNGQPPRGPNSLANGPLTQQYPRSQIPPQYGNVGQHYQVRPENNRRPSLPPGAMAPAEQSSWMAQPSSHPQRPSPNPLDPAGQHLSNVPLRNQHGLDSQLMHLSKFNASQESLGDKIDSRNPSRSLSIATPPASVMLLTNGHVRKGKSAHAVMYREERPYSEDQPPSGEEEDLPLAVWQRRRK